MTPRHSFFLCALLLLTAVSDVGAADGDTRRGAEIYRGCIGCHSLQPGVHMTGPSLANLWGKAAGSIADFSRYSVGLRAAEFVWDQDTLNAWVADPSALVPGTYMVFPGLEEDADRADLIAFLERAMAQGGHAAVVADELIDAWYVRGQQPDPLTPTPDEVLVTEIRHCGDAYFITTADGSVTPHWEMNVRLKVDTRATGPESGHPAVAGAGMVGDRVSVIFSSIDELKTFVREAC